MRLVEVIPIARHVGSETLTYFTSLEIENGALVRVPLRSKTVPGIVVSSSPAAPEKSALRRSPFQIKKLAVANAEPFLLPAFLEAARDIATWNATGVGPVLHALLPAPLLAKPESAREKNASLARGSYEKLLLQTGDEERLSHYRSAIRESFARKRSVILLAPTIREATLAHEALCRGIEEYAFLFHSDLPAKEQRLRWRRAIETIHPALIVMTPGFLSLPREDTGLIVLEHESSRAYHERTRPYLDMRKVAEAYAKRLGVPLLCGDFMLSIGTLHEWREGEAVEASPLQFRFSTKIPAEIADMRENKKDGRGNLLIVGPALEKALAETLRAGGTAFLFAARRGAAPITVCDDCGEAMRCERCGAPLTLYRENGAKKPLFRCPVCGHEEGAAKGCRKCGGWRLTPLGIGIERLEEEIRKRFPDASLFRLDRDRVKNNKEALAIAQKFYETKGAILLGTEMALGYLERKVDLAGIVSLDSLLSIPDITAHERIFSLLLRLRARSRERFIVETRFPSAPVLLEGMQGAGAEFYRRELSERESYGYPPLTILIKITRAGLPDTVREDLKKIAGTLSCSSLLFENASPKRRGAIEGHLLLKVPARSWPDKEIVDLLRALPPFFLIRVNPESVL